MLSRVPSFVVMIMLAAGALALTDAVFAFRASEQRLEILEVKYERLVRRHGSLMTYVLPKWPTHRRCCSARRMEQRGDYEGCTSAFGMSATRWRSSLASAADPT